MEQYISKSALVAEVERRIDFFTEESKKGNSDINIAIALCGFENFLDTLEVKEVQEEHVNEELEEEIHRYYVDWDEHPLYVQTARHFAKWQKERMVDKACNFIYEQLNNGIMECGDIETFINNYRKYMEE